MSVSKIREELHQLINEADDDTVNRIYEIMKGEYDELPLTIEQQADLEQRILRDERGESKCYTWDEAVNIINQGKILPAKFGKDYDY